MANLFKNISTLKGVGKVRASKYEKLGISTPYELFFHYPKSYVDYTNPLKIADTTVDEYNVIKCRIIRKFPPKIIRKGLSIYKTSAQDCTGEEIIITFFNTAYAFDSISEGYEYYFYGRVTENPLTMKKEMNSPQIVTINQKNLIKPVYHLTEGITNNVMQNNMLEALKILESEPVEILPYYIIKENNLMILPDAIKNIHFPESMEMMHRARYRFAFDELLKLQLGMLMLKRRNRQKTGYIMNPDTDISDFTDNLPFTMTNAQLEAIKEITADLCRNEPMNRLLQGDVGSGKTAVAAGAIYFAHKNGCQSALMAPTEILATQHYNTLSSFLEPLGMKVCLLTGSMTQKQKNDIKQRIADGEFSLIVGTHAIIQKNLEYKNLGLVITDEQHRFGVSQRNALAMKGESPHKLVMSATPIPRTLGLIIYGDLDISILNELPKGRIPIETYAVTSKMRKRAFNFIKGHIDKGRQAYIVCPMIEESDSDLQSVCAYADEISQNDFSGYRVGLLHGKMPSAEKDSIMQKFKDGEIDLLVSTTVIEVGVDVPNAVVMLIENSDRFGLSQLHQLRGRVGRGNEKSYCILITDNLSEESIHRAKIMSSTSDGFKISEEDLKMRGPGDFFGQKQHGLPPLKIADMTNDMELVKLTQKTAQQIIDKDENLEMKEHGALRIEIIRLFSQNGDSSLD
ncbi:MAG: ATP-dependent DNA helicase RecG [Oscillospiraceae bacterium]